MHLCFFIFFFWYSISCNHVRLHIVFPFSTPRKTYILFIALVKEVRKKSTHTKHKPNQKVLLGKCMKNVSMMQQNKNIKHKNCIKERRYKRIVSFLHCDFLIHNICGSDKDGRVKLQKLYVH